VLTPKQVNFFKPIADELRRRNHEVVCTSRRYREVKQLAQLKDMNIQIVGEHGGESLHGKLVASATRVRKLTDVMEKFNPDVLVSFSSPEAARVAFGLKIRHVGFSDSPHAEAVCRLSIPLMNKLMCPWIIPRKEFTKYGISSKSIIQYRALDPVIWLKHSHQHIKSTHLDLGLDSNEKTITFRLEESMAAYNVANSISYELLEALIKNFNDCNIVVLGRYDDQVAKFKEGYGKDVIIPCSVVDGTSLLMETDVFLGSGGTMNTEASLLGIPNISYKMQNITINKFLIGQAVSNGYSNLSDAIRLVRNMLTNENLLDSIAKKGKRLLAQMEDPLKNIVKVLEQVN